MIDGGVVRLGTEGIGRPPLEVASTIPPGQIEGDRDIDDSVTLLQDNIRVFSRPHLYLLDLEGTNASLLKLSLEYGPILRTKPIRHTSTSIFFAARLDAAARCSEIAR